MKVQKDGYSELATRHSRGALVCPSLLTVCVEAAVLLLLALVALPLFLDSMRQNKSVEEFGKFRFGRENKTRQPSLTDSESEFNSRHASS